MKRALLLILLISPTFVLFSQVDIAEYNRMQREYVDYVRTETAAFEQFKEERDQEFVDFLKKDWENYELLEAGKPIEFPGPAEIPVLKEVPKKIKVKKIPLKRVSPVPVKEIPTVQLALKPIPRPAVPAKRKDYDFLSYSFYGKKLGFVYPKSMKKLHASSVGETPISEFWTNASETDYYQLIEQILEYKNNMNLNDLAYLKLTENISAELLDDSNDQKLLTWFILNKSGYKLKVGFAKGKVHLMLPVVNLIYGYNYFMFDNLKYYIFEDIAISNIYTYKGDYPAANKIMNFNMYVAPLFGEEVLTRELSFSYDGKDYEFPIYYNKNLIDFCNDFPQGEIQIFFNAGISHVAKESLDKNIQPIIDKMSEKDAANFLLHFTQVAFSYQTDGEQFGYEKFFFPEEILHYKHADCEDRSVFFSYLVNEYLGLKVVGLNYPGHIATAVKFNEDIAGTYYELDNEKYVICDPTYINAPVGMCMPEYLKSNVSILSLNNSHISNTETDDIWNAVIEKGAVRTNYKNDIIKFSDNKYFITGIYEDSILVGNTLMQAKDGMIHMFIATVDSKGSILKINELVASDAVTPYGIAIIGDNIYVSGQYSGNILAGKFRLETKAHREMFTASLNLENDILWLKNTGIIQENAGKTLFFNATYSTTGEMLDSTIISEQSFDSQMPIASYNNKTIVFTGRFEGLNMKLAKSEIYNKKDAFEYAKTLQRLTEY